MTILALALVAILLMVAVYDALTYRIPNWIVLIILALYPLLLLLSPEKIEILPALAAAGICFVTGFAMFALKLMGGGDVKFITVAALWISLPRLLPFLLNMAILGGVLTILLLVLRESVALRMPALLEHPRWPRALKSKEPVPYGVAIAAAFLFDILSGEVPGISW